MVETAASISIAERWIAFPKLVRPANPSPAMRVHFAIARDSALSSAAVIYRHAGNS
jgi:hypothetical protein